MRGSACGPFGFGTPPRRRRSLTRTPPARHHCRLKSHSPKAGTRALLLAPTRELALQTHKAVRELSRGTDLRTAVLVGGDALEAQFAELATNPDVIVATPGRLLHHLAEVQGMSLKAVEYCVLDEADRLFEMGFAEQVGSALLQGGNTGEVVGGGPPGSFSMLRVGGWAGRAMEQSGCWRARCLRSTPNHTTRLWPQIKEILGKTGNSRQTLLFSATLPRSLADFAAAGLNAPQLVRLDTEQRVSPDLQQLFFTVRHDDKVPALLQLVREVLPADQLTIVFAATRHHVEYLANLMARENIPAACVYGSMDQVGAGGGVEWRR